MDPILPGVYQVSSGYVNAFLVDGDEGVTLVDTLLPKKQEVVISALASIGRTIEEVVAIVLTHSHADHAGSAAALKSRSGAQVYASEPDARAIRGEERPPPPPVADRLPWLSPLMRLLPVPPPASVEHLIGEAIGGRVPGHLRAIDTPGHTPGHTSYLLDRDGGAMFVGDAAVAVRGQIRRGYMNRPDPTFDASLRHIAEHDFDVALFGHARPIASAASTAFRTFASTLR